MGRIFNIYFEHEGHPYSALITIAGKKDCDDIHVNISNGNILIQLPNGKLILPIVEVLHRVSVSASQGHDEGAMRITDSISLQLLNTRW